jgi:hypothetical protein
MDTLANRLRGRNRNDQRHFGGGAKILRSDGTLTLDEKKPGGRPRFDGNHQRPRSVQAFVRRFEMAAPNRPRSIICRPMVHSLRKVQCSEKTTHQKTEPSGVESPEGPLNREPERLPYRLRLRRVYLTTTTTSHKGTLFLFFLGFFLSGFFLSGHRHLLVGFRGWASASEEVMKLAQAKRLEY